MKQKQLILEAIAELKLEKPPHWKAVVRHHLNRLAYLEDPFQEHEYRGTDRPGRKIHRTDGAPF